MNISANRTILFNGWDETTAQVVMAALQRRGLRVVRSFDLRSALATRSHCQAAPCDCGCADWGTDHCDCQYVVLLVYGNAGLPIALTVHSRAGLARLDIVSPANETLGNALMMPDPGLAGQVRDALAEVALALQPIPFAAEQ
jgi:hypothetical protein